jgi:hypothetical protein
MTTRSSLFWPPGLRVACVWQALGKPNRASSANVCVRNKILRDGRQPSSPIQSGIFGGILQWFMHANNNSFDYRITDANIDLCRTDQFVIVPAKKQGITTTCKCNSFGPPGCALQASATGSGSNFHEACTAACSACFELLPGRGTDNEQVCSHNSRGCR